MDSIIWAVMDMDMVITMDVNGVRMMMPLIDGNGVTHSKRSNDVFQSAKLIVLTFPVLMPTTVSLRLQPGTCHHSDVAPTFMISKFPMVIAMLLLPIRHLTLWSLSRGLQMKAHHQT
jgi:hypothetical protein